MNILLQPYPTRNSTRKKILFAFVFGLFVFLFLGLLQPFGIQGWEIRNKTLILAIYGGITTGMLLVNFFLFPFFFPSWFRDENWKVWKEMVWSLWNVFSIGTVNMLYSHWIHITQLNWEGFVNYQVLTVLVGIFPVAIVTLLNYNYQLRRNLGSARNLSDIIEKDNTPSGHTSDDLLILQAENGKDVLEVALSGLLFIASADNYVEVCWEEGGKPRRELLRNTLKNLSESLAGHASLFRCHRSYLVNLEKVQKVSGNSQGYKLHLTGTEQLVPVSRNLNEEIRRKISEMHKL